MQARIFSVPSNASRWLVALSFLLAALMPALSQALAHARGDVVAWSQVCRSSVVSPRATASLLAGQADQQSSQDSLHGLFANCPYCALHTQDLAPPPAALTGALTLLPLRFAMPERFYSAPHSAHAWAPAQSRAPPLTLV
ncbi:DUF2946 domain-containing protein [Roseateles oligotrophus]|uniref:DUF2946 domain-containing protein n=1 Tax=Roseateles oligotrophus TaxID=1769250 RepID=A0ABT2YKJ5_9BURK|nr:DUF2946 domain-containing protein [Roseateles oligotrophus]MCV2370527.1 DUF2946 domain-containing protein [Roseateles oligotrophus]